MLKRVLVLLILIFSILSFSYSYDFTSAGVSILGGIGGAFLGQNLGVFALIQLNKMGLIEEDIYSPFSTAIYDAMDLGASIGAVVGGISAKYIYLKKFDLLDIIIDSTMYSISLYISKFFMDDLIDDQFVKNIFVYPILGGIAIGGVW